MPTIYDNIENKLAPALTSLLEVAEHADFCVGYFNLRGWRLSPYPLTVPNCGRTADTIQLGAMQTIIAEGV